jgi:hypothetical protein
MVGVMVWVGSALLIDAWTSRLRASDLTARLERFQQPWIADEAQEWLRHR